MSRISVSMYWRFVASQHAEHNHHNMLAQQPVLAPGLSTYVARAADETLPHPVLVKPPGAPSV